MTVNKLDRCFLELMLDGEEAYSGFRRTIESANVIMATYADELLGDTQVFPEKGTVSFSAGLHGWAFTLTVFADLYAKKFGVEVSLPKTSACGTPGSDSCPGPCAQQLIRSVKCAASCPAEAQYRAAGFCSPGLQLSAWQTTFPESFCKCLAHGSALTCASCCGMSCLDADALCCVCRG